jgi:hypothetical protein
LKRRIITLKDLGIEDMLRKMGRSETYIERHACKYHFIINLMLRKYQSSKNDDNGYVRISPSYKQDLVGKARYPDKPKNPDWIIYRAIRELEEFGILETERYWCPEKSKVLNCRFTPKYIDNEVINYPKRKIEDNFLQRLIDETPRIPKKYKPIEELYKKVKLDKAAALNKLNEMVANQYKAKPKRNDKKQIIVPIMTVDKARIWKKKIEAFDFFRFIIIDHHGNRACSNATDFPRDLRCYNYLSGRKGEPLWELDIKNSQPLLMSILTMKWYQEQGLSIPQDVRAYKTLCENGKFYKHFEAKLNKAGIKTEDTFKTDVFARIFFNKESEKRVYAFRRKFDELFPSVGKCITAIKEERDDEEAYKELSKRLTEVESEIMLEKVSMKLIELGVEFFPLHDAIYTVEEFTETAKMVIEEEFKCYGIVPGVEAKKVVPVKIKPPKELIL